MKTKQKKRWSGHHKRAKVVVRRVIITLPRKRATK